MKKTKQVDAYLANLSNWLEENNSAPEQLNENVWGASEHIWSTGKQIWSADANIWSADANIWSDKELSASLA